MANLQIKQLQLSNSELIELPDATSEKIFGGKCIVQITKDDVTITLTGKICKEYIRNQME